LDTTDNTGETETDGETMQEPTGTQAKSIELGRDPLNGNKK